MTSVMGWPSCCATWQASARPQAGLGPLPTAHRRAAGPCPSRTSTRFDTWPRLPASLSPVADGTHHTPDASGSSVSGVPGQLAAASGAHSISTPAKAAASRRRPRADGLAQGLHCASAAHCRLSLSQAPRHRRGWAPGEPAAWPVWGGLGQRHVSCSADGNTAPGRTPVLIDDNEGHPAMRHLAALPLRRAAPLWRPGP